MDEAEKEARAKVIRDNIDYAYTEIIAFKNEVETCEEEKEKIEKVIQKLKEARDNIKLAAKELTKNLQTQETKSRTKILDDSRYTLDGLICILQDSLQKLIDKKNSILNKIDEYNKWMERLSRRLNELE